MGGWWGLDGGVYSLGIRLIVLSLRGLSETFGHREAGTNGIKKDPVHLNPSCIRHVQKISRIL